MEQKKLYCHYFHIKGSCKKQEKCEFIHGEKQDSCPNGKRCPICGDRSETKEIQQIVKEIEIHNDLRIAKEKEKEEKEQSLLKSNVIKTFDSQLCVWDVDSTIVSDSKMNHVQKKTPIIPQVNTPQIKTPQIIIPKNEEVSSFLTNFQVMRKDMKMFKPIYVNYFPRSELDLMFIVDCTGSMGGWIDAVKLEISAIIASIRKQHQNSQIRLSFVGYRDYGDQTRFEIFDFSTDLASFQSFVGAIEATGGNDAAEDVAGGFLNANQQQWVSQAKYAVLIADAPAHGKQFHNESAEWYDRYPEGDPKGVNLKAQFKNLLQKGVNLFAVEIMPCTKVMFECFQNFQKEFNGKELQITKLGTNTQEFRQFITQTASQTLSQSYTKNEEEDQQGIFFKALQICNHQQTTNNSQDFSKRFHIRQTNQNPEEQKEEKAHTTVVKKDKSTPLYLVTGQKTFPASINGKEVNAICHTYFIVQEKGMIINWKKPLVQNSSIKSRIRIEKQPFSEGAMRYAFFAEDTKLKQKLVAKMSKKQYPDNQDQAKEEMVRDLESQFICQHIVNEFNERAAEHVTSSINLKSFVHCFIYEIQDANNDKSNKLQKYYAVENYMEGDFVKFNNNSGWSDLRYDEPGLLSQALSHFSYQLTDGYLMIVDIQGVGALLTDPQIHCLDENRFGAGNLGYVGMFKYFLTHECNKYCEALNLIHPSIVSLPKELKFFSQKLEFPKNPKKQVFCMCDLCKTIFSTTADIVYAKRHLAQEKYCPPCDSQRISTMKSANCSKCYKSFKSSAYWFLMKRTDFPELCGNCRKDRREQMRAQLV